ncbi:FMN-binding protein [Cryobacterium frigoriphilum]|uniref:FMN-binding protein n=1 Tax=Cryobacterium frigoriphilum TaxID=1259150 RepID=A0A4R8ZYV9_9MICO|nr:FMN-binding protein [Cryobacterium frigoriphilum]TFD49138.1 FMN-binding protein [Cryobacterium frigoriphilum]
MRTRAVLLATVASVSVLGIGWQLGTQSIEASQSLTASGNTASTAGTGSTAATDAAAQAAEAAAATAATAQAAEAAAVAAASSDTAAAAQAAADAQAAAVVAADAQVAADAAAAAASSTAGQDGTFTGSVVGTRFGNVQVSVTIASGAITDVTALQLTADDRKSVQISARAAPILRSEVIAAQSANVQNVSGATYTTDAYLQSLQSALDAAGF